MRSSLIHQAREQLILQGVLLRTKLFQLREQAYLLLHFYKYSQFLKADLLLGALYLFKNPYRIAKQYLKMQGASDCHTYGETPLSAAQQIAQRAGILSKDILYDLGCGRGKMALWFATCLRCETVAIDWVPLFICRAEKIAKWLHLSNLHFICANFLEISFEKATVILLDATLLSERDLKKLCASFQKLPETTKIITTTIALNEFSDLIKVKEHFQVRFPWGDGDIFVHQISYQRDVNS